MDTGKIVATMALIRFFGAAIEIAGACLMLYLWQLKPALKINTILGGIGPVLFLAISIIGINAAKPPVAKLLLLALGVVFTFLGLR